MQRLRTLAHLAQLVCVCTCYYSHGCHFLFFQSVKEHPRYLSNAVQRYCYSYARLYYEKRHKNRKNQEKCNFFSPYVSLKINKLQRKCPGSIPKNTHPPAGKGTSSASRSYFPNPSSYPPILSPLKYPPRILYMYLVSEQIFSEKSN